MVVGKSKPKRVPKARPTSSDGIKAAKEQWETTTVAEHVQKNPEMRNAFTTTSGRVVQRIYTPLDIPNSDYLKDLGYPGEYPFTRGVQPTMYRGRFWTMRQFAGMGSAEESNARYKFLLANGQTGLSVAFHLPTLFG